MIIAIDIGNTNIKIAVCHQDKIIYNYILSTNHKKTTYEYFIYFNSFITQKNINIQCIKGVVISSVVPIVSAVIEDMCKQYLQIDPIFITNESILYSNITINLNQRNIGTDRIADLVAAQKLWPNKDLLVIDMGTVTVFNLLDKHGSLYGQIITPGISCLIHSMRSQTASLPQVNLHKTDKLISKSTDTSIKSGLYWGYIAMIEGIIKQIITEDKKKFFIIATGGGSNLFIDNKNIHIIDISLTIKGILHLYNAQHPI
ncbi:type III pantothenate kinase [Neoehrlichia mikurensis]|uniref:Type III pantothenate kinase n=1 Tax=Neoehrlichia mikurensis TaxID=89586 RepID=A0A9Q9BRE7_9RICK|nr:type III pantothenate kinase [Neoehrlichia mikurensis]QXK92158.1 type III pantothenate kinase [Neoehrlichia mikurensis]QXK92614.1 type III pantothenate kinase [Neoehrlichia mikurensis]QXK93852.1 type III pantothenate kinase [Neoehrlichia mikurensis]UTO55152.1 type III pantothenate kinase [Neoehrlichia mikurensis]UTO56072.1 type III pantothenate kinase [Neoehrlichia mikurensis]